jgi:hypothetical protein
VRLSQESGLIGERADLCRLLPTCTVTDSVTLIVHSRLRLHPSIPHYIVLGDDNADPGASSTFSLEIPLAHSGTGSSAGERNAGEDPVALAFIDVERLAVCYPFQRWCGCDRPDTQTTRRSDAAGGTSAAMEEKRRADQCQKKCEVCDVLLHPSPCLESAWDFRRSLPS